MYIHVGKAGGLTLDRHVIKTQKRAKKLACVIHEMETTESNATTAVVLEAAMTKCMPGYRSENRLSQAVLSFLHLWHARFSDEQIDFVLNHTNTFLYTVRSPVRRVVSAFNYHRYEATGRSKEAARFFAECYADMEELGQALRPDTTADANYLNKYTYGNRTALSDWCRKKARASLAGTEGALPRCSHFKYNYGHYVGQTLGVRPGRHVVAVRTEHLWEDAAALDAALGGTGHLAGAGAAETHGAFARSPGPRSPESARAICCHLHRELGVYQDLILRAENLNRRQKRDALRQALEDCGVVVDDSNHRAVVAMPFSWQSWHDQSCVTADS